jgi:NADH dehydrogenase
VLVDPSMRSVSHPDVFALGDAAHPSYQSKPPMQMGAFTATVTGAHVADNVQRLLQDRQLRPLSFAYYGQAIALGRKEVVGFNRFPDGNPHWPMFTGGFGARTRELFVDLLGSAVTHGALGIEAFWRMGTSRPRLDGEKAVTSGAVPADQPT